MDPDSLGIPSISRSRAWGVCRGQAGSPRKRRRACRPLSGPCIIWNALSAIRMDVEKTGRLHCVTKEVGALVGDVRGISVWLSCHRNLLFGNQSSSAQSGASDNVHRSGCTGSAYCVDQFVFQSIASPFGKSGQKLRRFAPQTTTVPLLTTVDLVNWLTVNIWAGAATAFAMSAVQFDKDVMPEISEALCG